MKKAAVEWLHYVSKQRELDKFDWEQAKEIEKEQMKMFYYEADSYSCTCYKSPNDEDFEKYYKETFKKD